MTIIIKNAKLIYPAIFEPNSPKMFEDRFATIFSYDGDEIKDNGLNPRLKDGFYGSNSKFAPEIHSKDAESDYTELVTAYNTAKVRGLSLNRLFTKLEVDLELRFFEYDNQHASGTGVTICKVWVDEHAVLLRARCTITQDGEVV